MSDSELIALAGKLEQENEQLAKQLSDQQHKDGGALDKLKARRKKMQDGGEKHQSSETKEAAERIQNRTATSNSLDTDEAKVEELQQGLATTKKAMAKARSDFEAMWAASRTCARGCKGGLPAASLLSARQLLEASGDPGAEHSKKIMKVQDLEAKRLDLKENIENGVMEYSSTQRKLMDQMDDLGVTLNLKSRKLKATKRMDKAHEKILAHQVAATKRYKDNLTKQLALRSVEMDKMNKQTKDLRDAFERCGCAAKR